MNIAINSSIVLLLITIIPAAIALVISLLRLETIRGDARAAAHELQEMRSEYTRIVAQFTEYTDRLSTLSAGQHAAGLRMTALEESLTSVCNKMSSRERADRVAIKRQQKEEEDEPQEIPGTKQQVLDLSRMPGAIPLMPSRRPEPVKQYIDSGIDDFPPGWNESET